MLQYDILDAGQPFVLNVDITADTTDNTFTLSTDNYDWNGDGTDETTPFKNKRLIITGIDFEIGIITGTAKLLVDDKVIIDETASAAAISVNMTGLYDSGISNLTNAVKTTFGRNIDCFNEIKITKSAAPGATSTVKIYGYAVPDVA